MPRSGSAAQVGVLEVGPLQHVVHPKGLRMPGTLPVTAQSPSGDEELRAARGSSGSCRGPPRWQTAPSTSVTSTSRELLQVDERAVDEFDSVGELEEPLVDVEERHVAAGTAVQPDRGEPDLTHSGSSRISVRYGRNWRPLRHLGDRLALLDSAPVGQTWTHLPQLVQVSEAPQGWFRSVMTRAPMPRPDHVPGVRALDLVADPDAARAEDAAVVVDGEALVRGVDRQLRVPVGQRTCVMPRSLGRGTAARSGRWRRRRRRRGCARRRAAR